MKDDKELTWSRRGSPAEKEQLSGSPPCPAVSKELSVDKARTERVVEKARVRLKRGVKVNIKNSQSMTLRQVPDILFIGPWPSAWIMVSFAEPLVVSSDIKVGIL
jgi:hypothetical protein